MSGFTLPVRIVVEVRRRRAGDGDQAVFGVVVRGEVVKVRSRLGGGYIITKRSRSMNYPAASGRGIKNRKPQMPSPQSGGVLDPPGINGFLVIRLVGEIE
jgi:hypothetical protein